MFRYTYVCMVWKIWPVLKLDVGGARTYMKKKVVDIYGYEWDQVGKHKFSPQYLVLISQLQCVCMYID